MSNNKQTQKERFNKALEGTNEEYEAYCTSVTPQEFLQEASLFLEDFDHEDNNSGE